MIAEIDPKNAPPGTCVIVYLRHSQGDNQTIESQDLDVRKFCEDKGWRILEVFADQWKTGQSIEKRTDFKRMMKFAERKPRRGDIVVVWSLSRFSRNQYETMYYSLELKMLGWQVLSITDDVPAGEFALIFEALTAMQAQKYIDEVRESTKRGLRFIADEGCVPSGRIAPGYVAVDIPIKGAYRDGKPRTGRKPEIDPEVAPLVIRAFEMKAHGALNKAIAAETGLYAPKSGTWNNFFRNRSYIGEYEFDGEVYRDIYPPLISSELFEAVQKQIRPRNTPKKIKHHPRRLGSSYFLANVAVCIFCQGPIEGTSTRGYRYYVCAQYNEKKKLCPNARLIPADGVEKEIIRLLSQKVIDPAYLTELCNWTNENLNRDLDGLQLLREKRSNEYQLAYQQAKNLAQNFQNMESPSRIVQELLLEKEQLVAKLQAELVALDAELMNSRINVTLDEIAEYVTYTKKLLDHGEFDDLREVVAQLCARIVMGPDTCRVEIQFPLV